jgi:hypothetical protein
VPERGAAPQEVLGFMGLVRDNIIIIHMVCYGAMIKGKVSVTFDDLGFVLQ